MVMIFTYTINPNNHEKKQKKHNVPGKVNL